MAFVVIEWNGHDHDEAVYDPVGCFDTLDEARGWCAVQKPTNMYNQPIPLGDAYRIHDLVGETEFGVYNSLGVKLW